MFDIIIKNGTVIDGTGKDMKRVDIGIEKEKIAAMEDLQDVPAKNTINALGYYITPGFIDIHNHSDSFWTLFAIPTLDSMLMQGVTTIVGGNCGSSLAPLIKGDLISSIQKWADIREANVNWLKMSEFLNEVEKRKISANFVTLIGHSTLRRSFLGDEVRDMTEDENKMMSRILKKGMKEGGFGLSSGLTYTHAAFASTEELIELAKVVSKFKGIYATHLRSETGELISAVKEALEIGREAEVSVQISHFKVKGKKNWPLITQALKLIERTKSQGVNVNFDVYPYSSSGSVLYMYLPDWIHKGGKNQMLSRLRDPKLHSKIIQDMRKDEHNYADIIIGMSPFNKDLVGRRISEIAQDQEISVEEAVIRVLISSQGHIICFDQTLSEDNLRLLIKSPLSMIGSAGPAYNIDYAKEKELVHPRSFGTFARVLGKYVREEKLISWTDAIRKMTSLPAEKLSLEKRGILQPGMYADITVFSPDQISDLATFENPYRYAQGVEYVLVNGIEVVRKGKHTGRLPGKVLRRR